MNKKGLEFKLVFFTIAIIGILITAVGIIVNDMSIEYGSGITSDLGSYNKIGEASGYIEKYQGKINSEGEASTDYETITYRGVFGIIANIFAPFTMITIMINNVFERYGIPDYIKQGLILMIIASVVFTLVAIIFRTTRPNV